MASISSKPADKRDHWAQTSRSLALKDYDAVERNLGVYLSDARLSAFDVGSTLRQWARCGGSRIPETIVRADSFGFAHRLMELPGAVLRPLRPRSPPRSSIAPTSRQLQAISKDGTMSFEWWQKGRARALGGLIYAHRSADRDWISSPRPISRAPATARPRADELRRSDKPVRPATR